MPRWWEPGVQAFLGIGDEEISDDNDSDDGPTPPHLVRRRDFELYYSPSTLKRLQWLTSTVAIVTTFHVLDNLSPAPRPKGAKEKEGNDGDSIKQRKSGRVKGVWGSGGSSRTIIYLAFEARHLPSTICAFQHLRQPPIGAYAAKRVNPRQEATKGRKDLPQVEEDEGIERLKRRSRVKAERPYSPLPGGVGRYLKNVRYIGHLD
ncbi:hypothetical protein NMY22_g8983 [Coprinellus aureogranulatus]|nr:hypothetical protein NMY22_g8983 [Coprinellus aureogranulatus]